MPLPADYTERVYAGILGKLIGVYLGRPFEGWTYEKIMAELGEVSYFVHEKLGRPLIVTDDDISGTFTFLRALPDYGNTRDLSAEQIGQTWLNYIIEQKSILWWGGLGNSTEHTAYLRLKSGIPAPHSGSMELNGKVVAEQIGAQIFIDGWAMVAPGDPELAVHLAGLAASVSHDGEAIYGAQVIAAMEAQAFVEPDINALIDTAVSFIPRDSVIYRLIHDIREWHAAEPDWHTSRERIAAHYGYDKYGGNCHMVPNHALIIHALLYGDDDFQKSLMIVNTCGWDTDCNSGNAGCLLGIKNGLAGINAGPDWRGPIADRMYLPTADGGRVITDAVAETYRVVNIGQALVGEAPENPKGGARFTFELPGSVQGFLAEQSSRLRLENVAGHSQNGKRSLALRYHGGPVHATTATFVPPEARNLGGYTLMASPTLYPGQVVRAAVEAGSENIAAVRCTLFIRVYGASDELSTIAGPEALLEPGEAHEFVWRVPDTSGMPVAQIGFELDSNRESEGTIYLDYLTWDGMPDVVFTRPATGGTMWRKAWVDGTDNPAGGSEPFRLVQNYGRGLQFIGTREWQDYRVTAPVTPHMVNAFGIGVRAQGMRRYYALLLAPNGKAQLVKALDGIQVLAEKDFPWAFGNAYAFDLQVTGNHLEASIDGQPLLSIDDTDRPLMNGSVAMICEEGRIGCDSVTVRPVES